MKYCDVVISGTGSGGILVLSTMLTSTHIQRDELFDKTTALLDINISCQLWTISHICVAHCQSTPVFRRTRFEYQCAYARMCLHLSMHLYPLRDKGNRVNGVLYYFLELIHWFVLFPASCVLLEVKRVLGHKSTITNYGICQHTGVCLSLAGTRQL